MIGDDDTEFEGEGETGEGVALEVPPPRENPALLGHEPAEAALLSAYENGRLPHAWLFSGKRGIGKATLAFRFARFLFAQNSASGGLFAAEPQSLAIEPSHPIFRRTASGGHADLLTVERGFDPKRMRFRSEIVVEDTRGIGAFLHLTPSEGGWRIVILDGADTMNRNAANALLKVLEEPPKRAVLLLVSDNPGRLLPTIRSRCRKLTLKPLDDAIVIEALQRYRPDLGDADRAALARLAEGSIGRALELATGGGLALYRAALQFLAKLPKSDGAALQALAEKVARSGAEDDFRLLGELLPGAIARMVASAASGDAAAMLPEEAAALAPLARGRRLDQWVEVWENLSHLFAQADSINLDRKQIVLNAFFALEEAAR